MVASIVIGDTVAAKLDRNGLTGAEAVPTEPGDHAAQDDLIADLRQPALAVRLGCHVADVVRRVAAWSPRG